MTLDNLLRVKSQARSGSLLDNLLNGTPLRRVVDNYLLSCKVDGKSHKTIEAAEMVLNRLCKQCSNIPNTNDLRRFFVELDETTLKESTRHIYYRNVKTFFHWLVDEQIIEESPMVRIHRRQPHPPVIQPFSKEDIQNLLKLTATNSFLDLRNRAIFLIFLDTGIRLEEMSLLNIQDIDFNSETIHVVKGKGGKGRMVRMGKFTQKALLKYILRRVSGMDNLWLTEEKRAMTRAGLLTMIGRYCKVAVKSGARPSAHTFRHTAAINCLRNGMNTFELQIMLGHSTLEMTRRYTQSLGVEDMMTAHRKASPVDKMGL